MATLKDVAQASGVSTATVSHVLHGRWERVSESTRTRVMQAVRELHYRPSPYRPRKGVPPSHNLTFMGELLSTSPILQNAYFAELLDGFMGEAWRLGYSVTVDVERVAVEGLQTVRKSFDGRCDGVALMAPCVDSALRDQLVERGVPLVAIGSSLTRPGICTIDADNLSVGRLAMEHLASMGHRKIAFLGNFDEQSSAHERLEGLMEAGKAYGIHHVEVFRGDFSRESGVCMGRQLLESPSTNWPTAVICANDEIAIGVLQVCREMGVKVPDQLSIVGTDDTLFASGTEPPLTTIRQPIHQMGVKAANLLVEIIQKRGKPSQQFVFPVELVQRSTTGPIPSS